MDLMIVPVPLFNKEIGVEAYYFRHRQGNDIIADNRSGKQLDGVLYSPPLEMLDLVGLEAFTTGKPIFVPINHYMLLSNLEEQCSQPADKIIFLLDGSIRIEQEYLDALDRLRKLGYRFGIQKIANAKVYGPILDYCDYIFFDHRKFDRPEQQQLRGDVQTKYRYLKHVFTHVADMDSFDRLSGGNKGWYEGRFYRTPITRGDNKVSPLQHNLINLLNMIRDEYIDFMSIANVIRCDAALSISLLQFINSPAIGLRNRVSNIHQAVTILGQDEVRKWTTSAVSKLLGTNKPNEITKLSLVRARFAEALAPMFGLEKQSEGLYLMGLFSVLDAILEIPMKDALQAVHVSDDIYEALVNREGPYGPVYQFLVQYESADWLALSRTMILRDLSTSMVYDAYVRSLLWYRDLLAEGKEKEEDDDAVLDEERLAPPADMEADIEQEDREDGGEDAATTEEALVEEGIDEPEAAAAAPSDDGEETELEEQFAESK